MTTTQQTYDSVATCRNYHCQKPLKGFEIRYHIKLCVQCKKKGVSINLLLLCVGCKQPLDRKYKRGDYPLYCMKCKKEHWNQSVKNALAKRKKKDESR